MDKIVIKNEITLRELSEDAVVLVRNGLDMVCPIIPPIPVRQAQPQASILTSGNQQQAQVVPTRSSCCSMCPLFNVINNEKTGVRILVTCGAEPIIYDPTKLVTVADQMNPTKGEQTKPLNKNVN